MGKVCSPLTNFFNVTDWITFDGQKVNLLLQISVRVFWKKIDKSPSVMDIANYILQLDATFLLSCLLSECVQVMILICVELQKLKFCPSSTINIRCETVTNSERSSQKNH